MSIRRIYVIVRDAAGAIVAQRYIEEGDRLTSWLRQVGTSRCTQCDVYDDAPALGGRRLRTLSP